MRYGIVINLDYEHHDNEVMSTLFKQICHAMEGKGFRLDGQIFTIAATPEEATALASKVIDDIEAQLTGKERDSFAVIKEFYGFDVELVSNLLERETEGVGLDELDISIEALTFLNRFART